MDAPAKRGIDKMKRANGEIPDSHSSESVSYAAHGNDGHAGGEIQAYAADEHDREADQGATQSAAFVGSGAPTSIELAGTIAGERGGYE